MAWKSFSVSVFSGSKFQAHNETSIARVWFIKFLEESWVLLTLFEAQNLLIEPSLPCSIFYTLSCFKKSFYAPCDSSLSFCVGFTPPLTMVSMERPQCHKVTIC